jgi:hypothetical protein
VLAALASIGLVAAMPFMHGKPRKQHLRWPALAGAWQDMSEPDCLITISADGGISYQNCSHWSFVGLKSTTLYTASGGMLDVLSISFFANRVSIQTKQGAAYTLQRIG